LQEKKQEEIMNQDWDHFNGANYDLDILLQTINQTDASLNSNQVSGSHSNPVPSTSATAQVF
jgi:hypothetical protein